MSVSTICKLTTILMVADGALTAQEPNAIPAKRVEVDKTRQALRAYEGDRLILESHVSTGRGNSMRRCLTASR